MALMDSEKQQASSFSQLLDMLDALEEAGIYYSLYYTMPRAISVAVDMPHARWELDYFEDGDVFVEKFVSQSGVGGGDFIVELEECIEECRRERKEVGQDNGVDAG